MMIKIITIVLLVMSFWQWANIQPSPHEKTIKSAFYKYDREEIEANIRFHAWEAKAYNKAHYIDTEYIFLIDYSIPSGFNRLFLYDYAADSVIFEALVAHGSGYGDTCSTWDGRPKCFSNVSESHLSSIGRYIIADRGPSGWGVGINYRLEGIDFSNDNANSRDIVLHSWSRIPDREVYPTTIVESWGCPAVSDSCFGVIDGVVYYRPLPMMLYIYN